jgi:DNA-binding MarR family transcriptional regulator
MRSVFLYMKTEQFYPITLRDALVLYKRGLLATSGLLYFFLRIRLAPGWKMTLHQREISQQLGISKSQFYRAIHKLSEEGLINWEAPNGLVVTVEVTSDDQNLVSTSETKLRPSELAYR